jgi:serine/threonine protein kinase
MEDVFGLLGTEIAGRYRIDAVAGEGGFGVVYRAFRPGFEDMVAVKCLKIPSDFTPDAKAIFLQRFREEGKLLAQLCKEHLSIVQVYDFGETRTALGATVPGRAMGRLKKRDIALLLLFANAVYSAMTSGGVAPARVPSAPTLRGDDHAC